MTLVLDASMALSWLLKRNDPVEAEQSSQVLDVVRASGAVVPALWYPQVANALLLAERQRVISTPATADFLSSLSIWEIVQDSILPFTCQAQVIHLSRVYQLTAYDAAYLELAMRRAATLATFDRKLAKAARSAGVRVFGDPAFTGSLTPPEDSRCPTPRAPATRRSPREPSAGRAHSPA